MLIVSIVLFNYLGAFKIDTRKIMFSTKDITQKLSQVAWPIYDWVIRKL